ncbi:MAG: SMC family ATPase, partial [Sulfurimonas sp.]
MILSNIKLYNFKKYTSKTIEFGEGLIGIIGKNGSGKSTIFEAILFALYGEAKTRGNKELLRNANANEKETVSVELEFEFEGVLYKIIREFRGKAMSANAKFYKNGSLTTSGAKEVTAAIVKLTKMSKDAFMHTLFASQKELTSLSSLKNEDRKKMIRKLLGLEKIDFVEKELLEKSRELKREIEAFREILLGEDEIGQKQEQIKESGAAKENLAKEMLSKTQELEHIKSREQSIKKELEVFAKTKEQKQKLFSELELLKNSKSLEILNQVKLTAELHQLEDKEEKLKKLQPLKAEFVALQEKLKEQDRLRELQIKKEGILKEQVQLKQQWKKSKADIETLERACEGYDEFLLSAKKLEAEIALLQESINAKQSQESELKAEISSEQKQIDITNQKIAKLRELGSDSSCPTCTRPLLEEYDNVINSLVGTVIETHQKKITEHKAQLQNVVTQKAAHEAEKKPKDKEFSELTSNIKIIQSKLQDLKIAKEHFVHVEQKGIKNKEELKELEAHSYDERAHQNIKESLLAIEPQYKQALSLETELKRVVLVKSDLLHVNKKIEELKALATSKEAEFKLVIYDDVKHKNQLQEHES